MAVFIKQYEIHLGDFCIFNTYTGEHQGRVQMLDLPEVWIEEGDPRLGNYKRYQVSIESIKYVSGEDFSQTDIKYEKDEPLEYVWSKDLKSKEIISKYDGKNR